MRDTSTEPLTANPSRNGKPDESKPALIAMNRQIPMTSETLMTEILKRKFHEVDVAVTRAMLELVITYTGTLTKKFSECEFASQ